MALDFYTLTIQLMEAQLDIQKEQMVHLKNISDSLEKIAAPYQDNNVDVDDESKDNL